MTMPASDMRVQTVVPFVDLSVSTAAVREQVLADLSVLMDTGGFVNSPVVEGFESSYATAVGRRHCVGVASGLDALRLALIALGIEPGGEVIVPAMTFVATFEAVVQAGGKPVVVDVNDTDANMNVQAATDAVGPRTFALLPVHLYGQMADVRALVALADKRSLMLLEDACQAHGARRDGVVAGAAGSAGAFSFYPSKNLGAMGDAGALVTDDDTCAATVRALRQHGERSRYSSELIGYTARLDALQAMVLTRKLPFLEGWNEDRRRAAAFYTAALRDVGDLRLPVAHVGAEHVWHLYAIRTAQPLALAEYLKSRGVMTGRHYPEPPHLSPAFIDLGLGEGAFPVAEAIARETLSLPIYPGIGEPELAAVVECVREFFRRGGRAG
jgi:dTDP-4-amino-4,6-dideoxygalactose transaminase